MLLFWFSCRMFSTSQRKLKQFKKKMEFLSIQLLPFSVVFFFLSLFSLGKKKRKGQKRKRKVHFNFVLLFCDSLLPPFLFSVNSFTPKSPKNASVSLGCFSECTHKKQVFLLVLRGSGGEEGSRECAAGVGQGFSVQSMGQPPLVPWEEQKKPGKW